MCFVVLNDNLKTKEELLDVDLIVLHKVNMFIHFNMIEIEKNAKEYWKYGKGKLSKIRDLSENHVINIVRKYGVENLLLKGYDKILARYIEINKNK